jgi:hypothetical protein
MTARLVSMASWLNLLVPGAGLVLLGRIWLGLALGLLFLITVNFVIASLFLAPEAAPSPWRELGILAAALVYISAQGWQAQRVRTGLAASAERTRRESLSRAIALLEGGDAAAAHEALRPLLPQAEGDLAIAYHFAEIVSAQGAGDAARAAWARVRKLDRHHIYRETLSVREAAAQPAAAERDASPRSETPREV